MPHVMWFLVSHTDTRSDHHRRLFNYTFCHHFQSKTDWDSAKKVLADNSFMDKLKNYDKVTVNDFCELRSALFGFD